MNSRSWPGLPVRALGDADQREVAEAERVQHLVDLADLPEAAVDQQQVRRRHLAVADARVAPLERLAQRAVVVPGRDAGDVEAAVLLLQRPFGAEHHARGHRALPARVADVEALDAAAAPRAGRAPRRARRASRPCPASARAACAAPASHSRCVSSTQRAPRPARPDSAPAHGVAARSASAWRSDSASSSLRPDQHLRRRLLRGVVLHDERGRAPPPARRAPRAESSCVVPRLRPPRTSMTLTAYSPGSPTMANTSTSRSPSAVTICCAWMRFSAASWSRICAARSNSQPVRRPPPCASAAVRSPPRCGLRAP